MSCPRSHRGRDWKPEFVAQNSGSFSCMEHIEQWDLWGISHKEGTEERAIPECINLSFQFRTDRIWLKATNSVYVSGNCLKRTKGFGQICSTPNYKVGGRDCKMLGLFVPSHYLPRWRPYHGSHGSQWRQNNEISKIDCSPLLWLRGSQLRT